MTAARPAAALRAESLAWQAHRAELVRFLGRRVRDPALAEDLAHDVLCKAHEQRASLREDRKLRPWLYRIARRVLADHLRSRQAHRATEGLPEDLPAPLPGGKALAGGYTDAEAASRELATCLRPLIEALPAEARDALTLVELQGLPQRTAASRLGLSLTAAKSRVQRARRLLVGNLLRCCRVEIDRRGGVVDYQRRRNRLGPDHPRQDRAQQDCRRCS
ncbi:MAG: sigma-70 family RNA polymerase sigma factor [Planctomycetota bacterium]